MTKSYLPGMMHVAAVPATVGDWVDFDGTNDWLGQSSGFTAYADTKELTLSFWLKIDSAAGALFEGNNGVSDILEASWSETANRIIFKAMNSAGTVIAQVNIVDAVQLVTGAEMHLYISLDLTDSGNRGVLLNGAAPDTEGWVTYTDDLIDLGGLATLTIGSRAAGAALYGGCIREFWMDDQYLDPATNLDKFYDSGSAVALGSDGSLPTGTQPLITLNKTVDDWHTNAGSGGGFTENGALTLCS